MVEEKNQSIYNKVRNKSLCTGEVNPHRCVKLAGKDIAAINKGGKYDLE